MRIIVTHDGRQHVNHLLLALVQKRWLVRFCTGFATNAYEPLFRWWPRLHRQLHKRAFAGVPVSLIRSFGVSLLLSKLLADEYRTIRVAYALFDRWVAYNLRRGAPFDLVIGYENSSRRTFRQAKLLGKTTVLDLAQVHHHVIDTMRSQFRINDLTKVQTDYVNQRKQAALDQTDYILTLSGLATQSLVDNGIDRRRIYEVSLGIDPAHFRPAPKPDDGRFRLLFVGTITHRKGVALLLDAFRKMPLPNAELTLVGPVGDGRDLLAHCTGTIRHVPFLHHNELVAYYQQADVFVFPSYLDSWGQVVLEAMACGTPVIVTENTGAKDAVAQGGGFVIAAGDELALSEKISYFYHNRGAVEQMGREARRVAGQYTWANYYRQITDALTNIARKEGINTKA